MTFPEIIILDITKVIRLSICICFINNKLDIIRLIIKLPTTKNGLFDILLIVQMYITQKRLVKK